MKLTRLVACAAAFLTTPLFADTLPAPKGEAVMTLSGVLEHETENGVVRLDMDQLQALPQQQFTTSTIWLDDPATFTGVALKVLLDHAGVTGSAIEAVALNDYKVEIPLESITDDAPIVAYLLNGEAMSPRDKGPLWVVYPFDAAPEFRTEVVYSRAIWQLDRIIAIK